MYAGIGLLKSPTNYNFWEAVDCKIGKLILQLQSKNDNLCEEI